MDRRILLSTLVGLVLVPSVALVYAQSSGTAAEARAMLEKAVAALKANEAAALVAFNSPVRGFRDRDLYVFCYNMADGTFTAHVNPVMLGRDVRTIKVGDDPLGQRIFDTIKNAPEATVSTVDYMFPKPGTTEPVPKESFVTRIGNQGCGVGYYK